jgi:2-dehydro-3-deoxygluconokinase
MSFSSDRHPDVTTLGEVLAVFLATDPVGLGRSASFGLTIAGAEANVAVGLARLGHGVAFAGRVGSDALGRRALRELRAEGVDTTRVVVDDSRPTGLIVRDAPAVGVTEVVYHRSGSAGSALCVEDLDLATIGRSRLLHVTGITAALSPSAFDACATAMRTARDAGVTVSFDPNVRRRIGTQAGWTSLVETLAPLADIVLVGADDASYVLPVHDLPSVDAWFRAHGADTIVWKDGARGAVEINPRDGTVDQPALSVAVRDAVGAGDAFAAGWISGWLDGEDAAVRLRRGAAAAASVVATLGDLPGLPDRSALTALMDPTTEMRR